MHDESQSGERHYLSEGSMAQLKPTCDTGGIAAIGSGEWTPTINLKAHHPARHCRTLGRLGRGFRRCPDHPRQGGALTAMTARWAKRAPARAASANAIAQDGTSKPIRNREAAVAAAP